MSDDVGGRYRDPDSSIPAARGPGRRTWCTIRVDGMAVSARCSPRRRCHADACDLEADDVRGRPRPLPLNPPMSPCRAGAAPFLTSPPAKLRPCSRLRTPCRGASPLWKASRAGRWLKPFVVRLACEFRSWRELDELFGRRRGHGQFGRVNETVGGSCPSCLSSKGSFRALTTREGWAGRTRTSVPSCDERAWPHDLENAGHSAAGQVGGRLGHVDLG